MARPTDWSETKERHQLRLTPTCWKALEEIAKESNLPSKAEVIEHLIRLDRATLLDLLRSLGAFDSPQPYAAQDLRISRSELIERLARKEKSQLIEFVTSERAPDRLNKELMLDSLKNLLTAFERANGKDVPEDYLGKIAKTGSIMRAWQRLQALESRYHVRIQTPFSIGGHYFVGATPLGETGWNGRPDFEGEGQTIIEAIDKLLEKVPEN